MQGKHRLSRTLRWAVECIDRRRRIDDGVGVEPA